MMNKVPKLDSSPDPEQPKQIDPLAIRPKAAFQWPPNCVWPFIDLRWDSET